MLLYSIVNLVLGVLLFFVGYRACRQIPKAQEPPIVDADGNQLPAIRKLKFGLIGWLVSLFLVFIGNALWIVPSQGLREFVRSHAEDSFEAISAQLYAALHGYTFPVLWVVVTLACFAYVISIYRVGHQADKTLAEQSRGNYLDGLKTLTSIWCGSRNSSSGCTKDQFERGMDTAIGRVTSSGSHNSNGLYNVCFEPQIR